MRPRHAVLLTRSGLCTLVLPPRSRHCRGCDESRSVLTSSKPGLYIPPPNCDARNSFRIRFYENCQVSPTPSTLFALLSQRAFDNLSAIKRMRTLSENCRGVPQQFPFWNSTLRLRRRSRIRPLAFSYPLYSIYAAHEAVVQPQVTRGFRSTHGQLRPRSKSPTHAANRLPVPLPLQRRPQHHRPQLSLARPAQRFPRHGHVAAHAHPSCLARCASPAALQLRQLAGSLRGPCHAPWFADGFSGAHRGAAGRLRKLLSAVANRGARNGFPHAEPPCVLGHGGLVPGHDRRIFNLAPIGNHALDRQR